MCTKQNQYRNIGRTLLESTGDLVSGNSEAADGHLQSDNAALEAKMYSTELFVSISRGGIARVNHDDEFCIFQLNHKIYMY